MSIERAIRNVRQQLEELPRDEFCSICDKAGFLFDPNKLDPGKKGIRATNGKMVHIGEPTTVSKLLKVTGCKFERIRTMVADEVCHSAHSNRDQFARFCRVLGVSLEEATMLRKFDWGVIVTITLAVIAFAFYLGGLNRDVANVTEAVANVRKAVAALDLDAIKQAHRKAVDDIQEKAKLADHVRVGTIVPYAGTIEAREDFPKGWLLCNGDVVPDGTDYDELRELLRTTAWGSKDAVVHLPDLRGMFLRGVDDPDGKQSNKLGTPPGNDEDSGSRYVRFDRETLTAAVGSVQDWATGVSKKGFSAPHTHRLLTDSGSSKGAKVSGPIVHLTSDHGTGPWTVVYGTPPAAPIQMADAPVTDGDKETRPKNAYVNFIIKY